MVTLQSFKMQKIFKQIFVLISAITLIIASGGLSLYQQYCICANEVNNSIVLESTNCNEKSEGQSCCTIPVEKLTSCLHTKAKENTSHQICTDVDNCCTSEVTFLKTDDFNYSQDQKKSFHFIPAFVSVLESVYLHKDEDLTKKANFIADLPPPASGKEFLILLHQLKIAPSIA